MIRRYKLKKRLPAKKLLQLFLPDIKVNKGFFESMSLWRQIINSDDEVIHSIAALLDVKPGKINNCVMHIISDSIMSHADRYSTGVYLIPIKYSKTCEFFVEDSISSFSPGFAYKFNDFRKHGINNPYCANMIIISVDTR